MKFEHAYALIIGVGSHKNAPEINVPITVRDAKAVEEILKDGNICGYPADHVTLLKNDTATKDGILNALKELAHTAKQDDTVFIFYCGHGAPGTDGDYYLVSHEAQIKGNQVVAGSGVSAIELIEALEAIRTRRVLMIFNACFSGNISTNQRVRTTGFKGKSLSNRTSKALLARGEGRIIITACRENQKSQIGTGPLTIFTQALVDGLKGNGGVNSGGYISAYLLYEYVFDTVSNIVKQNSTRLQEPELTVSKGVGPFAVALYSGSAPTGDFDDSQPVPSRPAVRQVTPEQALQAYKVLHNDILKFFRRLDVKLASIMLLIILSIGITIWQTRGHGQPPMSADFNIAVASFGEMDDHNHIVDSRMGYVLAQSFCEQLGTKLLDLQKDIPNTIQLRGPKASGNVADTSSELISEQPTLCGTNTIERIIGNTPEKREENAAKLAQSIEADLVIYGYLTIANDQTSFVPEFYISPAKMSGQADELTGQHQVQSTIQVLSNIRENIVARSTMRADMQEKYAGGARALANFIIGLSDLQLFKLDDAVMYFNKALNASDEADPEIRKIFYLFLGRTAVESEDWDSAKDYYSKSLELQSKYARAQLGYADMLFQKAKDNCASDDEDLDAIGLENAIAGYKKAFADIDQTDTSGMKTKVHFYLGAAYACQSQADIAVNWSSAFSETQSVIDAYNSGDTRLQTLASEAHANLGLIYWDRPDQDFQAAIEEYHTAISLTLRADRKAVFYSQLAQIFENLKIYDQADEAWSDAIAAYDVWLKKIYLADNPGMSQKYIKMRDEYQAKRPVIQN